MASSKRLPTIWAVPDDLWERIEKLLHEYDPPKPTGRKPCPARPILDALIFRLRTGCQWNHLPKVYGDDSTIYRRFRHWIQIGLFEMVWLLLAAANVNDHLLLEETIEALVLERPEPTAQAPQNLCLDGGYNNAPSREVVAAHDYQGHIRPGGIEELDEKQKRHRPRRWVVERTFAWLSKCRGLIIRYEVGSENYRALLQLACALLWYRRLPAPASAFS